MFINLFFTIYVIALFSSSLFLDIFVEYKRTEYANCDIPLVFSFIVTYERMHFYFLVNCFLSSLLVDGGTLSKILWWGGVGLEHPSTFRGWIPPST